MQCRTVVPHCSAPGPVDPSLNGLAHAPVAIEGCERHKEHDRDCDPAPAAATPGSERHTHPPSGDTGGIARATPE